MIIFGPQDEKTKAISEALSNFLPSMSLTTEVGALVRFTGAGGYAGENQRAHDTLEVGREYEVLAMSVGNSSSTVTIAGGTFNTVMFENTQPAPNVMPNDGRLSYCQAPTQAEEGKP